MNKEEILKELFPDYIERINNFRCPFCNKKINLKKFKDELSIKEFKISGLCYKCQDKQYPK